MPHFLFKDRFAAAKLLAQKLSHWKSKKNGIILAIPRGGLQLGSVLSKELSLPLDIILTKKIGHPLSSELAIGAVSLTTESVEPAYINSGEVPQEYIQAQVSSIRDKLKERYRLYRGGKKMPALKGKIVIIVDDGLATGSTMNAAVDLARKEQPQKVIVAVPVGSEQAIAQLRKKVDEVICLHAPLYFTAIGQFYEEFPQVEDVEAIKLLKKAGQ